MNRSKILVLGGLLSAALTIPAMPALAEKHEHFERHENNGKHKGWEKSPDKPFDEHDRRYSHRPDPRFNHRDGRYNDRSHHNKAEIRQDFKRRA